MDAERAPNPFPYQKVSSHSYHWRNRLWSSVPDFNNPYKRRPRGRAPELVGGDCNRQSHFWGMTLGFFGGFLPHGGANLIEQLNRFKRHEHKEQFRHDDAAALDFYSQETTNCAVALAPPSPGFTTTNLPRARSARSTSICRRIVSIAANSSCLLRSFGSAGCVARVVWPLKKARPQRVQIPQSSIAIRNVSSSTGCKRNSSSQSSLAAFQTEENTCGLPW